MQEVTQLKLSLMKLETVTIKKEKSGITFKRISLIALRRDVVQDNLFVSDEAVRVLDRRE